MANKTAGHRRIEVWLPEDVAAGLDSLRAEFGHTMRDEIEVAARRHLNSPPPVPTPPPTPPPPAEHPLPTNKRGRGRPRNHPAK